MDKQTKGGTPIADLIPAATEAIEPSAAPPRDEILKFKEFITSSLKTRGFDSQHEVNFNMGVDYLTTLKTKKTPKGLLLLGDVGTGKTTFLRAARGVIWLRYGEDAALSKIITSRRLTAKYIEDRQGFNFLIYGDHYPEHNPTRLFIDDLGTEPEIVDYGNRLSVLVDVLLSRYEVYGGRGWTTYISSNLSVTRLEKKYGRRITSRLLEMCEVVVFEGADRRKTK